ncbi:MAG: helix-turn-helix domain-containing protein, partial [Streptosporangiaceae bacterium]
QAGERLGWSIAKLSRIETARVGLQVADLKRMLDMYGVEAGDKREALLSLARRARTKGWWDAYADSLPSDYTNYISLEAEAVAIRCYDAQTVNGLLQTEHYAREVIRAGLMALSPPAEVERRVEVRTTRQNLLTREDNPLRFWTVIDEAALTRPVGPREMMRQQYEHLLKLAEYDNVTIQVLLNSAGVHPATAGMFAILEFPERLDSDVVYVEAMTSSLYVESDAAVYRYTLAFDHLRAMALGPRESKAHIAELAEQTS